MLGTKRIGLISLLALPFLVACSGVTASQKTTPEARDAKKDTKISTVIIIGSLGDYGALARCAGGGEYDPITNGSACFIESGETMQLKIYTKTAIGGPDKAMIYEVTAHNNNSSYICDDKGAIERGYAATFQEIVLGQATKDIDVCTTVTQAGHDTTEAKFTVTERPDGIYVEFENLGGSWVPTGGYPNSTGEIKVDFSQLPD